MFLLELDHHCVFHSLSASLPSQALRASSPKGRALAKQKAGRTGGQVCVSRILYFFAQSAVPERPALRAGKAEQTISRFRRSCFYSQSVPDGRVFLSAGKALFRSNLMDCKEKQRRMRAKRPPRRYAMVMKATSKLGEWNGGTESLQGELQEIGRASCRERVDRKSVV